jgi:hypothetical protein
MSFDTADADSLVANGQFTDVVLHEMGHVLVRVFQRECRNVLTNRIFFQ